MCFINYKHNFALIFLRHLFCFSNNFVKINIYFTNVI